jgi:hypothetical protein
MDFLPKGGQIEGRKTKFDSEKGFRKISDR